MAEETEEHIPYNEEPVAAEEQRTYVKPSERMFDTAQSVERVILVGVSRPPSQMRFETDEHLEELELLTETAGAEVVEKVFQNRASISVTTFVGKGKAEFLAERCEELNVQTVIFDDDLSPVQQRNLERKLNRKVLDRTSLILDIFALHARTNAAKTQVELAQLEYMLPRLTRMWTHLSKQYGGIGTKGPGETQIETDRRIVRDRIAHLKDKLGRVDRQRATQRKNRRDVTRVSLVGYTNVGKSTLLNMLTGSDVLVEDKLFATLDSTVRAVEIEGHAVLFSDTVGFIRKLPTRLIESFKSTLDEVVEADIILHVIDIAHPYFRDQIDVVRDTLKELGAQEKPTIMVFNKIDRMENAAIMTTLKSEYPYTVFISAARGMNIGELKAAVLLMLEEQHREKTFVIRPPDFAVAAEFHRLARIVEEKYEEDHIEIRCVLPSDAEQRLLSVHAGKVTLGKPSAG
ncbi:MAG: GTPase HflX [Bacteroidota bacterium]|nr:GTPase HflX [Bacteroidota bacterium]